ncbi:hypothetical protein ACIF70_36390 [Actinacidiphila glaucinigra]|uniref:hypothetical protein n=1 Tax=Actinacidiphila glaucinigra TaxID=235986 RepID=UPI0037C53E70
MAIPAPPQRICARFAADGARCTIATTRADGWCGKCDGYTTAHAAMATGQKPARSQWRWGPGPWAVAELGMDSDEAYEIDITPGAIATYTRVHSVAPKVADTQIRSLLEDLISEHATTLRNAEGAWRVYFRKHGYGLLLSQDRTHVLRYCTWHAERTWAQHRTGIASRISAPGGMPAWKREAVAKHIPLPIAEKAVNLYARHALGLKATAETIDDIAQQIGANLRENVLPKWDRGDVEAIDDGHGNTWRLIRTDDQPDGIVTAVYATGSAPPQQ